MAERTYRIQKAAELAGVPAGLLRAWERRYGVVHPRRTGGGYRAYTESDVELLRRLRQLTEEGVAISDAVRLLPDLRRELKERVGAPRPAAASSQSQLALWQERALQAARRLDQRAIGTVLDEVLAALPPLAAWELVLAPLQREVGARWHDGALGVAEEHAVTHEVRVRLLSMLHGAPRLARRHVVCACLPREDHEIGLLGAALRFRHAGFRVTYLGPRTPVEQVLRTVEAVKPDLVALSSVSDPGRKELRATLKSIASALPSSVRVVIGGRAAEEHADVCDELGLSRIVDEAAWRRALA